MKVQIYEIRSVEDAKKVIEAGADHIGVPYAEVPKYPGHVTCEEAKEIFEVVPSDVLKIGLTISEDLEEILRNFSVVVPDVLHLSGDIEGITPDQIKTLKEKVPGLKIMQAIPVYQDVPLEDQKALDYVKEYERVSDYFLIDTKVVSENVIGATGKVHDWNIDRAIVDSTDVPCIIAGGLSSENVAEAIRISKPYGVDSFTSTNYDEIHDEKRIKDPDKVKAFVEAARNA
ncbi:phosphoribosylanthranilate isomerase [Alkalibacillus aidingensis]|uniref:phosphoribosylanthranilate isomerase n=1 Tax=Alkalibacillus aidingensis TaxID=2747607 RepID=UPI0016608175|nr:phosphoribosylanthranilate isomerase [Alkalibacillus aidingensis]